MAAAQDIDDFDFELPSDPLPNRAKGKGVADRDLPSPQEVKKWPVFYPIYLDAKQSKAGGLRRVGKQHAIQWPLARSMATAAHELGFTVHLEAAKRHPADWSNPGRIRVQLTLPNGKPVNSSYPNKLSLLYAISARHQRQSSTPHVLESFAQNSPALSHGILQHAIENPTAMMPPGFEGFMGGDNDATETAQQIQPAPQQQSSSKKPKKKVITVRR